MKIYEQKPKFQCRKEKTMSLIVVYFMTMFVSMAYENDFFAKKTLVAFGK